MLLPGDVLNTRDTGHLGLKYTFFANCLGRKEKNQNKQLSIDLIWRWTTHKNLYMTSCFIKGVNTIWVRGAKTFFAVTLLVARLTPITPDHLLRW